MITALPLLCVGQMAPSEPAAITMVAKARDGMNCALSMNLGAGKSTTGSLTRECISPDHRPQFEIFTASDLLTMELPDPKWAVAGIQIGRASCRERGAS